jgi:hypothetical protein
MLTPNKHQADALPDKQNVIHFVIASEKGQFEQLGETLEQRLAAYKSAIRDSAQLPVEGSWIAGIHLNNGIPHAHVIISRQR